MKSWCDWSLEREEERVGNEAEKGGWGRSGDVILMAVGSPWRIGGNKANINLVYMVNKIIHCSVEDGLYWGECKQ